GYKWARMFIHWDEMQPTSTTTPNWSGLHASYQAMVDAGFSVLVVFNRMPPWVYGAGQPNESPPGIACSDGPQFETLNKPPLTYDYFYNFTRSAATALGDVVAAWELWNEPNQCKHFRGTHVQFRNLIAKPGFDGISMSGYPALVAPATLAGGGPYAPW